MTLGNVRDALIRWAQATEDIGRKLFGVALVYTILAGVLILFVLVVGSC